MHRFRHNETTYEYCFTVFSVHHHYDSNWINLQEKKRKKKCSAFIIQYGHGGWANGLLLRAWICTSTTTSTTRQLKTQKADAAITAPNVYISLSIYCCSRFRFFFHSLSYLQIKYDRCEIKSSFFNSSTLFHHDNSVHLHSANFCFFSAIV